MGLDRCNGVSAVSPRLVTLVDAALFHGLLGFGLLIPFAFAVYDLLFR